MTASPICLALDGPDPSANERIAAATYQHVGVFKVGLTSYIAGGRDAIAPLAARRPVFLDLKFHDIPAQVAGAVAAAAHSGASLTTVHAAGGRDMLRAAADAAADRVQVLAVTVLTSLDDEALAAVGIAGPAEDAVLRLAELAVEAGLAGLVCSPREVEALRARFGPRAAGGPLLVVPGIRPHATDDDQKRTLTPEEALEAGADLLVIGRPVTAAADPGGAVAAIEASLARGMLG